MSGRVGCQTGVVVERRDSAAADPAKLGLMISADEGFAPHAGSEGHVLDETGLKRERLTSVALSFNGHQCSASSPPSGLARAPVRRASHMAVGGRCDCQGPTAPRVRALGAHSSFGRTARSSRIALPPGPRSSPRIRATGTLGHPPGGCHLTSATKGGGRTFAADERLYFEGRLRPATDEAGAMANQPQRRRRGTRGGVAGWRCAAAGPKSSSRPSTTSALLAEQARWARAR